MEKRRIKTINIISLGCSKNLVDTEHLMAQLKHNPVNLRYESNVVKADAVVINTCGFINDAKQQSIDVILEQLEAKKQGKVKEVYVMGCLSERYKPELLKEFPDADGIFGVKDIPAILQKLNYQYDINREEERFVTTSSHFAYLKISEGCDKTCSFCAIPGIRGKHQSVPIEKLIREAQQLANSGVKELILIAQDLTYYGHDLYHQNRLADLLKGLAAIEKIEWIRLHYAYPTKFLHETLEIMASEPKICAYLDIPFQHIDDQVLTNMRRNINQEHTYKMIERIRQTVPGIALRTTLLVGHPGETEEAFEALKKFVKEVRFERLGVFTYSEEEGTYGARTFKDEIPEDIKAKRADEIMQLQQEISAEINQQKVGKVFKVLIDRQEGTYYIGRTEFDSPEVDGEVLIETDQEIPLGSFVQCLVNEADEFDLYANLI
ncbi:MAG: 30S ribosomal protein S12 methylthiotransferase RimO [Bacteroidales bacterium]|nr:30S ribosomal protein S12 methylthiotransferase RimO [Bacteroidales bacterium]